MVLVTRLIFIVWAFVIHFTTATANSPAFSYLGPVALPNRQLFPNPPVFPLGAGNMGTMHAFLKGIMQGTCRPMGFDEPGFSPNGAKMGIGGAPGAAEKAPGSWWRTIFEVSDFYLNIAVHTTNEWIAEAAGDLHQSPIKTALKYTFNAANIGVWMAPRVIWGPAVDALGFGTEGIRQGTVAAAMQSMIDRVEASSLFAYLQSAGAGGYGAEAMNTVVRGGMCVKQFFGI